LNLLRALKGFYAAWMRFAKAVGRFNTRLLLSLVFYLIISPISLLSKVFSGNRLEMEFKGNSKTFWIKRSPHKPEKNNYEKQF
jgi:hypothetical protein